MPFLGFRLFPHHRLLGKANLLRFRRRLRKLQRAYAAGTIDARVIRQSIVSWWGHAQHADAQRIAEHVLRQYPFCRKGSLTK